MITQLLVLTDPPPGTIGIGPADTKVWACGGCGAQLTSADLHGTSAESVIDHADDCPEIAKAAESATAAAVEAERARILSGAESLKHSVQGKAIGIVDWDELADLIEGKP